MKFFPTQMKSKVTAGSEHIAAKLFTRALRFISSLYERSQSASKFRYERIRYTTQERQVFEVKKMVEKEYLAIKM